MVRTRWGIALGAIAVALGSAACAQPGQLGYQGDPPQAAAAAAPVPVPDLPEVLGVGTLGYPVDLRTLGPATVSVRTVVIPPGGSTGWHRHPGTETAVVTGGTLTVLIEDGCDPIRFDTGDALFVADAVPHLQRNDGTVPVEMVATFLLAPGLPDRAEAPPACPS